MGARERSQNKNINIILLQKSYKWIFQQQKTCDLWKKKLMTFFSLLHSQGKGKVCAEAVVCSAKPNLEKREKFPFQPNKQKLKNFPNSNSDLRSLKREIVLVICCHGIFGRSSFWRLHNWKFSRRCFGHEVEKVWALLHQKKHYFLVLSKLS